MDRIQESITGLNGGSLSFRIPLQDGKKSRLGKFNIPYHLLLQRYMLLDHFPHLAQFLWSQADRLFLQGVGNEILQGNDIVIADQYDHIIPNDSMLTVGINDYIPAVHEAYFPASGYIQSLTAAETIISYLVNIDNQVNYPGCDRYFRFEF